MVISTENQVTYNGDGINTAWPYTFQTIDKTDVKLMLIYENGTKVEIDSDYYVDAVNNTVYYPGYAPGAEPPEESQPPKVQEGQKLMLYRKLPLTQEADLGDSWPFSVIEKGLDKLTMLVQDVYGWYNRNVMTYKEGELAWDADHYRIADVENPIDQQDVANKQYVDNLIASVVAEGNDVIVVDTVASMVATDLQDGMFASTGGYDSINDGGAAFYRIRAAVPGETYDHDTILLANGNVAEKITTQTDTDLTDREEHENGAVFVSTSIDRTKQDATVYNGYMFYVNTQEGAETGLLEVLNLDTNTVIASNTLDGGYKPHGNVICFGKKQNASDTYPLLYITGYNGEDNLGNTLPKGTCFVYKVNDDLTTTFVQEINIGFTTDDVWTNGYSASNNTANYTFANTEGAIDYGDFIVDYDNDFLYVITDTTSYPVSRMFKFALPSTSSASVTLQLTDVIDYKNLPLYRWPQGAEYYKGKIYFANGYNSSSVKDVCGVAIIDLEEGTQVGYIPHKNYFSEMEAVFVWDDKLYIGGKGQPRFINVSNYQKVNNLGDIRALQTRYNTDVVKAINFAKETARVMSATELQNGHFPTLVMVNAVSTATYSDGFCHLAVGSIPAIKTQCIDAIKYRVLTRNTSDFICFKGFTYGADYQNGYYEVEGTYIYRPSDSPPVDRIFMKINVANRPNIRLFVEKNGTNSPTFYLMNGEYKTTFPALINSDYPVTLNACELIREKSYILETGDAYAMYTFTGAFGGDTVIVYILLRGTNTPTVKDVGTVTGKLTVTYIAEKKIQIDVASSVHGSISCSQSFAISLTS